MALEYIEFKDADGVRRKISADEISDRFTQVIKQAYGAEDSPPVLVSSASPMPVGGTLALDAVTLLALESRTSQIAASPAPTYSAAGDLLTWTEILPSGVTVAWTATYDGSGNMTSQTHP